MSNTDRVLVESAMGPANGYYHNQENGTWINAEEMDKQEAKEKGYSPCSTCFPEEV